jgi:hypothetical protein
MRCLSVRLSKPPELHTSMPRGPATAPSCGHHARGLAPHHQPARLALLAVETHILDPILDHLDEVVDAGKAAPALAGEAVVADHIHVDQPGTARFVEELAEPLIGAFGFLVAVGADQPIEGLADRQRHLRGIVVEHCIDLVDQRERLRARFPDGHKAARPRHRRNPSKTLRQRLLNPVLPTKIRRNPPFFQT